MTDERNSIQIGRDVRNGLSVLFNRHMDDDEARLALAQIDSIWCAGWALVAEQADDARALLAARESEATE